MPRVKTDIQLRLRLKCGDQVVIGPGKIALLEAIGTSGSISAAARALGMSYRRAWLLVDEMNRGLVSPVIRATTGGTRGGGATLTDVALQIIERYRAVQATALVAAADDLSALLQLVAER